MRIAREIIETLRMELGFLKVGSPRLSIRAREVEIQLSIPTEVRGIEHPSVPVVGFLPRSELRVSSVVSKASGVTVRSFVKEKGPPVSDAVVKLRIVESRIRETTFKAAELGINTFNLPSVEPSLTVVHPPARRETLSVKRVTVSLNKAPLSRRGVFGVKLHVKHPKVLSEKVPTFVHSLVRRPEPAVERETLLEALKKLKEKYDVGSLRFYGYYKHVPLSSAKMVKVTQVGNLSILLRESTPPERLAFFDVLIFKFEDRFVYYVHGGS